MSTLATENPVLTAYKSFLLKVMMPITVGYLTSFDPVTAINLLEQKYAHYLPAYQGGLTVEPTFDQMIDRFSQLPLSNDELAELSQLIRLFIYMKRRHEEFVIDSEDGETDPEIIMGNISLCIFVSSYYISQGSISHRHLTKHSEFPHEMQVTLKSLAATMETFSHEIWPYYGRPALRFFIDTITQHVQRLQPGTLETFFDNSQAHIIEMGAYASLCDLVCKGHPEWRNLLVSWFLDNSTKEEFTTKHCFPTLFFSGIERCHQW
jgi:hypothetical protein